MEEGQRLLGLAVEKILDMKPVSHCSGRRPRNHFRALSGDSSADLKKKRNPGYGLINFDAHFDLRPYEHGPSSGSMFRQIADIYKKEQAAYHYLPLGIQEHSNTVSLFKYAKEIGADYIHGKGNSNLQLIRSF